MNLEAVIRLLLDEHGPRAVLQALADACWRKGTEYDRNGIGICRGPWAQVSQSLNTIITNELGG